MTSMRRPFDAHDGGGAAFFFLHQTGFQRMALNEAAQRIADAMIADADGLRVAVHSTGGVRVIDCGVKAAGSVEAGIGMARAAMAGLGQVWVEPPGGHGDGFAAEWPGCPWPVIAVKSDQPLAACLASQYAGWKVSEGKYFAMASGPIRAAIGREDLFDAIGMRERPAVAVGLLEASKLPPVDVCLGLAKDAGVAADALILLVARTASIAGTLQVIARSLETALHKLHDLHFDLRRIRRGSGRAPLAPVPSDDLTAIGRTNDAILYGGHVVLAVEGDDESLLEIGPRMVSSASADYGEPFCRLFEKAGCDFYALDPALFAPALVEIVNIETGRRHRFGALAPEIVARSFAAPAAPGA
jgi:methenyltetrahydromethanopterin cyclohydrolase